MRLSRNLTSLGLLLFGLGAIFGSLLIATFGQTLGTIVGLFFVLMLLGQLIFEPSIRIQKILKQWIGKKKKD